MPNSEQMVPLNVMIKRLEEANARAHERVARAHERVSESQQDAAWHPSDQQKPPAVPDRQSSRGLLASRLIGLLFAATTIGVVAFAWQSPYFNAAKLIVARWVPLAQTTPQGVTPTAAPMSPDLARRLQTMAHDLANVAQGIEQLMTSQEQMVRDNEAVGEQLKAALSQMNRDNAAVGALKTALSQMTRDNAAVAEQLKAALSQMTRDNAAVVEQLKATQEQMVRLTATRARRKPVPTPPQAEAQPQAPVYSPYSAVR
jgi:septal ring factor EnvC (AmiA/AmiB activator)